MHPSLATVICMARSLYRSIKIQQSASGHNLVLAPPQPGQPERTVVLKCITCGASMTGWRDFEGTLHV